MGATPVNARVVIDRNRITGAGVTAGLDFGLQLASVLRNQKMAQGLQLSFEYDPQPPYKSGTPQSAPADITQMVTVMYAPVHSQMRTSAMNASREWK